MTKRTNPAVRTEQLLQAALELAQVRGWAKMTRECIAMAANVSPALVSARLGTMTELRRSVMRAAVKQRVACVVAEGLVAGDRHARAADVELKKAAAEFVCR